MILLYYDPCIILYDILDEFVYFDSNKAYYYSHKNSHLHFQNSLQIRIEYKTKIDCKSPLW